MLQLVLFLNELMKWLSKHMVYIVCKLSLIWLITFLFVIGLLSYDNSACETLARGGSLRSFPMCTDTLLV